VQNIQDKTVENENNIKYIKTIKDDLENTETRYKELVIETNFLKLIPRQTNYISQQIIENHLKIVLNKLLTENAKEGTDRFTKVFNADNFDYEILFDEMVCKQVPEYLKLMEEIFKNYRTATVRGFKDAKIKIAKQRRDLEEKFSKK